MVDTYREALQTARLARQTVITNAQTKYAETAENVRDELDTLIAADAVNTAEDATYRPLYSSLASDSANVNTSVTLVASGLSVTLGVGTYEIDAVVLVTTAAAADLSLKWGGNATVTATVGVSDMYYVAGPHSASDGTVAAIPVLFPTSWTTETEAMFATTGALADTPLVFKGRLVVTVGGTLILEFTQGTSDGSNTHIDKGSYLVARRVA